MATVNAASLRDEFEAAKAGIAALRRDGGASAEAGAPFRPPIRPPTVAKGSGQAPFPRIPGPWAAMCAPSVVPGGRNRLPAPSAARFAERD